MISGGTGPGGSTGATGGGGDTVNMNMGIGVSEQSLPFGDYTTGTGISIRPRAPTSPIGGFRDSGTKIRRSKISKSPHSREHKTNNNNNNNTSSYNTTSNRNDSTNTASILAV
jgi:hypothetical protein